MTPKEPEETRESEEAGEPEEAEKTEQAGRSRTAKAPKAYEGKQITITYEVGRCLHAAECVRGLPGVFDTARRPWIQPDGAAAEQAAEVIRRCPSGALRYRLAGGPEEEPDRPTTVVRDPAGRLVLRGDLSVTTADGEVRRETRAMLCACGVSANQPFCDLSGSCHPE